MFSSFPHHQGEGNALQKKTYEVLFLTLSELNRFTPMEQRRTGSIELPKLNTTMSPSRRSATVTLSAVFAETLKVIPVKNCET